MTFSAKKTTALLLAGLLLLSGCNSGTTPLGDEDRTPDTAANGGDTTAAETEPEVTDDYALRMRVEDSLPADADLGGETIHIAYMQAYQNDSVGDAKGADVVGDAVYARNTAVKDRLNADIQFMNGGLGWDLYRDVLQAALMAGSHEFDILHVWQSWFAPFVTNGSLLPVNDAPYIDYTQPWWAVDFMKEFSVNGTTFHFLAGDINPGLLTSQGCIFFNKPLYGKYFESADSLYQTVLDGKWTYETLYSQSETFYVDVNGDGIRDTKDQLGYGIITGNIIDHLFYDAGAEMTTRDTDGKPVLNGNSEHNVNLMEWILRFCYDNTGSLLYPATEEGLQEIRENFISGKNAFLLSFLNMAGRLRDMEDDYGIIPYPKYDENQASYLSLVHDDAPLYALPADCTRYDDCCLVLEAMAAESYRRVTLVNYEKALKTKYVRDAVSSRIIDIIRDNPTTDFGYIYSYALDNIGLYGRIIAGKGKNIYTSYYRSHEGQTQKYLDELIAKAQ